MLSGSNVTDRKAAQPSASAGTAGSADPADRADGLASRAAKKAVSGYFTPELSRALHMLVLAQGWTLQALMAWSMPAWPHRRNQTAWAVAPGTQSLTIDEPRLTGASRMGSGVTI